MTGRARAVVLGVLATAILVAGSARAEDAGADAAPEGGTSCATSADCVAPAPYCDTTRHACVECLSHRNCAASTGLCDMTAGVCVPCLSDLDCGGSRPYCDTARERCVECRTDANCGNAGVTCVDGECGSCGDGICGPDERVILQDFWPGEVNKDFELCVQDCGPSCTDGVEDLGSALGENIATVNTAGLQNRVASCVGSGGPEAWFTWTAPRTGRYAFDAVGSTMPVALSLIRAQCSELAAAIAEDDLVCLPGAEVSGMETAIEAGSRFLIAVDARSDEAGTLSLSIRDRCDVALCGGPSGPDGGGAAWTLRCLANARDRGDPTCPGLECACAHCAQEYDDCGVIPGCTQVSECMAEAGCAGADCYESGACRSPISAFGGLTGPALRAATALQECAAAAECELPCPGGTGDDAGTTADAGAVCESGRSVSCTCDGGPTGERRCNDGGTGFGDCVCEPAPSGIRPDGGCSCRVGLRGDGVGWMAVGLLGLAGVALRSRRRAL